MADLDVQPKNSTPAWLWPLVALIALGLLFYLVKGCNHTNTTVVTTDSTKTVTDTTRAVAVTQPDWDNVDFNSPNSADPDITDKDIVVRSNDKYTIYTLGENILFATDQNTLQGNAGEKLKMITTAINKRFKGASIGVYGNTDATGSASHNKQLGADRATVVRNWMVSSGGMDSTRVSVHTLGATKPVATNATPAGRQQNRNVEIVAFPLNTTH
jgi:outer membrane protein OmpA-like peptidoglycan-associated protein